MEKNRGRLLYVRLWVLLGLVLAALSLSSCVTLIDPETFQEERTEVVGRASQTIPVGQTLVSRRSGLNGAWLWLSLPSQASSQAGSLIVDLFHSPGEDSPLISTRIPFGQIENANPVYVSFPVQDDPPGQSYYLRLSTDEGSVQVQGKNWDVYPDGSAFSDSLPINSDLAFRLTYEYALGAMVEDLLVNLRSVWLVIPLGLVLFLPGWLLLDSLGVGQLFDPGQRLALAIGLSLAIIPVLMTWTTTLGLAWDKGSVTVGAVILSALSLGRLVKRRAWLNIHRPAVTTIALVVLIIATLFVRYAMARDLAAPPWVDSVHHGMLTRLILEHGSFPESYAPYLQVDSTRYHPGFHSGLAAFLWLSGFDIAQGMLVYGQVLNALMVLGIYLLATKFGVDQRGGVFAAMIAGFFTPMPAYYTSWGRYTQLAGLMIMPVVFVLLQHLLEFETSSEAVKRRNERWKLMLLAGIAGGGLFLTHYRVALFAACLVGAELLARLPGVIRRARKPASKTQPELPVGPTNSIEPGEALTPWIRHIKWLNLGWVILAGLGGLLLVLPWLPETLLQFFAPKLSAWSRVRPPAFEGFSWTFLTAAWGKPTLWLAGLGFLVALLRRQRFPITLLLWIGSLFFLSNLGALGLPGSNFVNTLSVEISLFIPIAILGGYFLDRALALLEWITPPSWRPYTQAGTWLGAAVVCIFAAQVLIPILNPITFLYRSSDRPALEWIEANIPEGETVLINPFPWGYGLYAGNDGGYWIPALAGRPTMPPPVLYGVDNNTNRIQQISRFSQQVIEKGGDATALYKLMQEQGIRYVYTGARGGPISTQALLESVLFEVLYNHGSTRVFSRK